MERLPDLLVLDFCEWLQQSILRKAKYDSIDMWDLLFDDKYANVLERKSEEYCEQRIRQSEDWSNTVVRDMLTAALRAFYGSDEFCEMCYRVRRYREQGSYRFMLEEFQKSFEQFRHSQSGILYDIRLYDYRRRLYPDDLINNLKFCFKESVQKDEDHDMNTSSFFQFMMEDEPIEVDFLKWLEEENIGKNVVEKVDLMPLEVFEEDDFDCGIMISASHNPYYDNGIKLIDCYGEKMPEEILLLVEDYIDGKLHVFDKDWPELPFAHREHIGCTVDYVSGRNRYMGYLISLGIYSFKGVKVGLDCANGSSWNIAKSVFDALGADTYVINAQAKETNATNTTNGF